MKRLFILLAIASISFCSCKKYTCHCEDQAGATHDKKIKAKSDSDAATQCALYNADHIDYFCELQK